MKYSYDQLLRIMNEAQVAGRLAGQARLNVIKGQVNVLVYNADPITGERRSIAGTMHDLCGMAYCLIPKRVLSLRSKAVKRLVVEDVLSDWNYHGALCLRLPILDQGISVREATANAAVEVLKKHGIDCYMDSRLD